MKMDTDTYSSHQMKVRNKGEVSSCIIVCVPGPCMSYMNDIDRLQLVTDEETGIGRCRQDGLSALYNKGVWCISRTYSQKFVPHAW